VLIRFGHEISMTCQQPTAMVCLVALHPERQGDLVSPEVVTTDPPVGIHHYLDLFGNQCRRFIAPAGVFTLASDSLIRDAGQPDAQAWDAVEVPLADLPDETLVYLMGSRYCETDRLSQTAWDMFGASRPGWSRVQDICNFVHGHIRFDYMQASSTRTAWDGYCGRTGVCRDFAHLAITLTRAMNIPARYVNGYLGDIGIPVTGPMDFSAWMEVYLGGRWWTFDPRNNVPRIGRIVVARGRDAADVPLVNSFGPHVLSGFRVWTDAVAEGPVQAVVGSER
jgi:transglutaminase-like putative cysteine protease